MDGSAYGVSVGCSSSVRVGRITVWAGKTEVCTRAGGTVVSVFDGADEVRCTEDWPKTIVARRTGIVNEHQRWLAKSRKIAPIVCPPAVGEKKSLARDVIVEASFHRGEYLK